MSRFARIGLFMLLGAASVAAYLWWFSPERQIRRVLTSVAQVLSHDAPVTPLAAFSAASGLQSYLSPDVTIEPGGAVGALRGRDAVMAAAARVRSSTPAVRLEFVDVKVTVAADDQSAGVDCTAVATLTDRAGQQTVDAREVVLRMNVIDGRWMITEARAVEVLEPVTP